MSKRKRVAVVNLAAKSPRSGKLSTLVRYDDGSYRLTLLDGHYMIEQMFLNTEGGHIVIAKLPQPQPTTPEREAAQAEKWGY